MKSKRLIFQLLFSLLLLHISSVAQIQYYIGTTSSGGSTGQGTIIIGKTDGSSSRLLFNFPAPPNGNNPKSGLIRGSDGNFYGMCPQGGVYGNGTIFRISPSGFFKKMWDLNQLTDGGNPISSLLQASDGNFYGMCQLGGLEGNGTIFKISSSGIFTKLRDLSTADGINPSGGLVQGSDSSFYGMCEQGGTYNSGTIFKITSSGTFVKLRNLITIDGETPYNNTLTQGADGFFYGTCPSGGINDFGTIFKISSTGVFTKLLDMTSSNGMAPSSLTQGLDSNFYGVCGRGGTNDLGTIFKITSAGVFTKLRDLEKNDGSNPSCTLTEGIDGYFYGTCYANGANGDGSIFKISKSGIFTKLLDSFSNPQCSLAQDPDGNFYGMIPDDGAYNLGSIFKITPSGVLTTLFDFSGALIGNNPGSNLVKGTDNNMYGMCNSGGLYNKGTIYKISPSGTLTKLRDLNGSADGYNPTSKLIQGTDSSFYGVCEWGGSNGGGTVFKITPSGLFTKLLDMKDGFYPSGGLVEGTDNNFYGMCYAGGVNGLSINGYGTIFKISSGGLYTKLLDLTTVDGINPVGNLVKGIDGNFYGICSSGGIYNNGTIFKITSTGTFTKLLDFTTINGINPASNLVQGIDGDFYGVCPSGGTNNNGTFYKFTTGGVLTKLKDFKASMDGDSPFGNLAQGSDEQFYGMCTSGGTHYNGTIFKITSTGAYTKLLDLDASIYGSSPVGSLSLLNSDDYQTITGFSSGTGNNTATLIPIINTTSIGIITSSSPVLNWSSVLQTKGYCIEISNDSSFSSLVSSVCGITDTFYIPSLNLFKDGKYFWHVSVASSEIQSYWSKTGSFTLSILNSIKTYSDNNMEFEIFPNPTTGSFTIKSSQKGFFQVEVYNSLGQYISNLPVGEATLPKGLYLLRYNKWIRKLMID